MKALHGIGFLLLIIGGLNWGLIAVSYWMGGQNWNVVNLLLGKWPVVENVVYLLVGLSAIVLMFKHKNCCVGNKGCCASNAQRM